MRVVVCGSRETGNPRAAKTVIDERISRLPAGTLVIAGGARGVDTMAVSAARLVGLPFRIFVADWDRYPKQAGIIRNIEMLNQNPDLVIAFWNGQSKGTLHTITVARERHIETEVIPIEPV